LFSVWLRLAPRCQPRDDLLSLRRVLLSLKLRALVDRQISLASGARRGAHGRACGLACAALDPSPVSRWRRWVGCGGRLREQPLPADARAPGLRIVEQAGIQVLRLRGRRQRQREDEDEAPHAVARRPCRLRL
jgi:hypothetical protein